MGEQLALHWMRYRWVGSADSAPTLSSAARKARARWDRTRELLCIQSPFRGGGEVMVPDLSRETSNAPGSPAVKPTSYLEVAREGSNRDMQAQNCHIRITLQWVHKPY